MSKRKVFMSLVVVLLLTAVNSFAGVIMIPADQPNIQAGLDAAVDGDTVMISDGVYVGEGNTNLNFMGKAVVLKSENGVDAVTIDCADSAQAFIFDHSESAESKVLDITIINGFDSTDGGAVYCYSASPTISGCIFENNTSDIRGGAIYCTESSAPTLSSNIFRNNTSSGYGGAVYLHWYSTGVISGNEFYNNSAVHGGALILDKSTPAVSYNLFVGNTAYQLGGAVFIQDSCMSTIENCTFVGNKAVSGAGMYIEERYDKWPIDISLTKLIFAYNEGNGLIFVKEGMVTMSCSDFYGNIGSEKSLSLGALSSESIYTFNPQFCDMENGDYTIANTSICAPENNDCEELIGCYEVGCIAMKTVALDIKPGSCPNPLNMKDKKNYGKSVLPVAILGSEGFDINEIDISTVTLLDLMPIRYSIEDVSSPVYPGDSCYCEMTEPDGYDDLSLKFSREDVIKAIAVQYTDDMNITLTVSGYLKSGDPFTASDCVLLKHSGDLDMSGEIDINDLMMFIDYMFNDGATPVSLTNTDFNDDNIIDVSDVLDLADYMFKD